MLLGEFVFFFPSFLFFYSTCFIRTTQIEFNSKFQGDNGFGTICKIDAGCYAQGFFFFLLLFQLFQII